MNILRPLPGLDLAGHQRHALHGDTALWQEKNCYIDLWIELVHALGCDPHAMLGAALPIDFEGDQWTFFKPSHDALRSLYGIDVQELNVWRPLIEHAVEHLSAGKLICAEVDAFWLPDAAGTDYRRKHTKTTVVFAEIDLQARRLVYFHNVGCFSLQGEDFLRSFGLDQHGAPLDDPSHLPLFAELARVDRLVRRPPAELRGLAEAQLRVNLAQVPTRNPVRRFGERFDHDLPGLRERGLDHYHAWAFGTVRQLGAAFELVARQLDWLATPGHHAERDLKLASTAFNHIAAASKTLILKAARAVSSSRPVDTAGLFDSMARAWDDGMGALASMR